MLKILISNSSKIPIYEQISTQIKDLILTESIKEGDALPSIRSLASDLKISVITTKRAYEELENEGYIETIPQKGSFVAPQNKELLLEKKLQNIEKYLIKAIDEANSINLSKEEVSNMLSMLYGEI
ncbi:MAG: GntR family transcriptional regulator [Clostridium sp.]|uniref:GntR family transcriptional regulator n=1 Tax=Clostridium sp. TaxID=1506 RepID=UPI002FC9A9BA